MQFEIRNIFDDSEFAVQLKLCGDVLDVSYEGSQSYYDINNIDSQGYQTYVISPINKSDKYSIGYCNCTGLALIGRNRDSGIFESLISHQDPRFFLGNLKDAFLHHLHLKLEMAKERLDRETIKCAIFGGNYLADYSGEERHFTCEENRRMRLQYIESVSLLRDCVKNKLGESPVVAAGPSLERIRQSVIFVNDLATLLVFRKLGGKNVNTAQPFSSTDIESMALVWDEFIGV